MGNNGNYLGFIRTLAFPSLSLITPRRAMKIFDNISDYFKKIDKNVDAFSEYFYITRFSDFVKRNEPHQIEKDLTQPHKRNFFEIAIIVQNSDNINIGDINFEDIKCSLVTISPFQVVSFNNFTSPVTDINPKHDIDGFLLFFKPSFFSSLQQPYEIQNEFPFFKIHTSPIYKLSENDFESIYKTAEKIYEETKGQKLNNIEMVRSFLLILLFQIKRITYNSESEVTTNRFAAITSRFEQIISANNGKFYSVQDYASRMNISAVYLSECVKEATGKTAKKIIIDYKVLYAQSLLHQTDKLISEIAEELDFIDVSNFTKFFKRNTGLTPKQFRNK